MTTARCAACGTVGPDPHDAHGEECRELQADRPDRGPRLVLDVCAGIGGWAPPLRAHGYTDLAVENGRHARAALVANGIDVYHDDLDTLLDDWARKVWLRHNLAGMTGSTPCQPFSQANGSARGLADPRGNLTLTYLRVAETIRPPFVTLENVARGTGDLFDVLAERLAAAGYAVDHRVMNAADYGLPQARKRRLLAARRDGHPITWPTPTHVDPESADGRRTAGSWAPNARRPWVTLAETFPERAAADRWPYWTGVRPSTTIVGSYRPECVAPPTYRKPGDGPRQSQPGTVVLSLEERLRVQGFPDGWHTSGPRTARDLQVGNAIPPALAEVALAAATGEPS